MAAVDDINRIFREFNRYTGDGLQNPPTNAPLPIGDPQSGVCHPKKSEIRWLFGNLATTFEQGVAYVQGVIPAITAARDQAISAVETTRDQAIAEVEASTEEAEAAAQLAVQAADQAAVVGAGDVPTYPSRTLAAASNIPPARTYILLAGYGSPGDGGKALYKRVASEPPHQGKFQSKDGAWWEITEQVISPIMIGVLRNSAADQTVNLQAWLDVLKALGVEGYVPPGTYRLDGGLISDVGLTIRCHRKAVFDCRNAPAGTYAVSFMGTIGTFFSMTASSFVEGVTRIRGSLSFAQSLVIGDLLKIKSDNIYDSFNTSMKFGELVVVAGLVDAATGYIDLTRPISATYSTTPQAAKVTPIRDLVWEGGKFEGAVAEQNNQKAIRLQYVQGFTIRDVRAERFDDRILWIQDSCEGLVDGGVYEDARPASTGYGVSVIDATQDVLICNGTYRKIRHAFSTNNSSAGGGIPRRITFADNTVLGGAWARAGSMGPGDAVDTHGAAEAIFIERNVIDGSPGAGINFECRSGAIRDNKVIRSAGHGIACHNESDFDGEIIISGNTVKGTGDNGIYCTPATRGATSTYQTAIITDNVVDGFVDYGIQFGFTSSSVARGVEIKGNRIRGGGSMEMFILNIRAGLISNNTIQASGTNYALRMISGSDMVVSDNVFTQPNASTFACIFLDATTSGGSANNVVSGNRCAPFSGSITGAGVLLSNNVTGTLVVNNNVRGTGGVTLGTGANNTAADNLS